MRYIMLGLLFSFYIFVIVCIIVCYSMCAFAWLHVSMFLPFYDNKHACLLVCIWTLCVLMVQFAYFHLCLCEIFARCCICVCVQCCQVGEWALRCITRKWEMSNGGWNGNLRWSELTWRWSSLPQGHELSVTAGVSMLFPGPLAQVRQRRRVREGNSERNRVTYFHS